MESAPSDGSGWRRSMVPKMGVPFSWVIGSRRWAFTFTPASVAATGWDEGIYLIILYGRRSLDG